jgi:threonine dehydrogenase-like Zn-dependent dehydrogenase
MPEPPQADGSVLVQARAIGVCGTDGEIVFEGYGWAPPGEEFLVLGHESIGEVLDAPAHSGLHGPI